MTDKAELQLLDHQLADDELNWMKNVFADFNTVRKSAGNNAKPKEILREILGRKEHQLASPMELSGDGPWRNGRNRHGRFVACVFLKTIELHKHAKSRTDQFPMYVVGEADGFSVDSNGQPVLTTVSGGDHCHNAPGAPHAFLPKVGKDVAPDWEIAFIAITPRNLKEDTQEVSMETKILYQRVVGMEAPAGV